MRKSSLVASADPRWASAGTLSHPVAFPLRRALRQTLGSASSRMSSSAGKLKGYGIGGTVLQWIDVFLSGRRQRVVVNGSKSTWAKVTVAYLKEAYLDHIIVLLFGRDTSIYTTAYKRYVIANEWFILACHVTREQ